MTRRVEMLDELKSIGSTASKLCRTCRTSNGRSERRLDDLESRSSVSIPALDVHRAKTQEQMVPSPLDGVGL